MNKLNLKLVYIYTKKNLLMRKFEIIFQFKFSVFIFLQYIFFKKKHVL